MKIISNNECYIQGYDLEHLIYDDTQFPVSITLGTTAIQFNAMYTVTEKTVYWNSNGGTFSDGST